MVCNEVRRLVDAHLDGELDVVRHSEIESHLDQCAGCRALFETRRALQAAVRTDADYFHAPAGLEPRVRDALGKPTAAGDPTRAVAWHPARFMRAWRATLVPALAAGAILVLAATSIWLWRTRPAANERIARDVVSSHIRSLMPGHLTDVPSSDQHTVKPWFDGKTDFSPPVRDLDADGFALVGGRLDYVGGRSVAALVYRRRQHVINVFIWPSASQSTAQELPAEQGYNLTRWAAHGNAFWAISDLNRAEMKQFVQRFEHAAEWTPRLP